jgi:hypothetical protein
MNMAVTTITVDQDALPRTRATPLAWLVGLCFGVAVLYPITMPIGPGIRTTDLANLICAGFLAWDLLNGKSFHPSARTFAIVAILSYPWVCVEFWNGGQPFSDSRLTMILFRWLTGLSSAYWLASRMSDRQYRLPIILGMICGCVISLTSLVLDPNGADPYAIHQVLTVWKDEDIRGGGVFGHPNAAAAAILFIVPLVLGLINELAFSPFFGLLVFIPIGLVFDITQTRSTSIIAVIMVVLWTLFGRPENRSVRALSIITVAAFITLAYLTGFFGNDVMGHGDPLHERVADSHEVSSNMDDRLWTIYTAFRLSIENPFGLASTYLRPLIAATNYSATHNAYLQLSLLGGLLLTGYVTTRLWRTAFLGAAAVEGLAAIYMCAIFFFENHLSQAQIIILTLWLLWRPSKNAAGPP